MRLPRASDAIVGHWYRVIAAAVLGQPPGAADQKLFSLLMSFCLLSIGSVIADANCGQFVPRPFARLRRDALQMDESKHLFRYTEPTKRCTMDTNWNAVRAVEPPGGEIDASH